MDIYGGEVKRLIEELGRLPGIGAKTAQRLAFRIVTPNTDKPIFIIRSKIVAIYKRHIIMNIVHISSNLHTLYLNGCLAPFIIIINQSGTSTDCHKAVTLASCDNRTYPHFSIIFKCDKTLFLIKIYVRLIRIHAIILSIYLLSQFFKSII